MENQKHRIIGTIPSNHPDLEILVKNCQCKNELRSAVGSTKEHTYEGHYLRVTFLKYWNSNSIEGLKNSFNKTNEETQEFKFELIGVDDWETDDDRYWDASFTFLAHKK
jgi:hypothetical protein